MTALDFHLPARLEAAAPPPVRDDVRLLVAQPGAARPRRASSTSPTTSSPATCSSSTPPRRSPPRCRRPRADGTRSTCTSRPPTREPLAVGRGAAQRRPPRAGRRGGRNADAPRRRHARRCWSPTSRPAACGSRSWTSPTDLHAYLQRPRRPDPLRPRARGAPAEDHQTIFATVPGSAEMPSAGRPFTRRALTAPARARGQRAAHRPALRRQLAGARRAPLPRALRGLPAHRGPRQRRQAA